MKIQPYSRRHQPGARAGQDKELHRGCALAIGLEPGPSARCVQDRCLNELEDCPESSHLRLVRPANRLIPLKQSIPIARALKRQGFLIPYCGIAYPACVYHHSPIVSPSRHSL